jgi:hypothetical protein
MEKELVFRLTADVTGLERAMKEANEALNTAGDATEKNAKEAVTASKKLEKAAEDLTKADKKLVKASDELSDATEDSGISLEALGEAAGDTDSKLKALAGAVGIVSPELESALTSAGDLAGGFEVLSMGGTKMLAVLGPVAVAVGILAAAYLYLKQQLDIANEAMEEANKMATEAEEFSYRMAEIKRQEAVITGELSSAEADLARITDESERMVADVIEATTVAIQEKKTALDEAKESTTTGALAINELTKAYEDEVDLRDKAIKQINIERDARAGILLAQVEAAKAAEDEAARVKALGEAQKARAEEEAEALRREAEATAQLTQEKADQVRIEAERMKAEREALKVREDTIKATDALSEASRKLQMSQMDGIEAIEAMRANEVSKLESLYETARAMTEGDSEQRLAIEKDYLDGKAALNAEYDEKAKEEKDKISEEDKARIKSVVEASMQAASMLFSALVSLAQSEVDEKKTKAEELKQYLKDNQESLTDDEKKAIRSRIKEQRAAARKIAKIQKALAINQILTDTALGIMSVWAQWAAYPPVAIAMSAAVAAVGIAQGVNVARQKTEFATGGIKVGRTDMEDALPDRLSAGEAVLTRSATARLGEDGVAALNAGGMPKTTQVYQVWKNKVFDPFVSEVNRVGGSLNDIIMASGRTPGHSRRSM